MRPSARRWRALRRAGVAALRAASCWPARSSPPRRYERISDSARDRWDTFASDAAVENTQTGARLGQVIADKRYDYWTVALDGVPRPARGRHRRRAASSRCTRPRRRTRSTRATCTLIWLRALSETGVVGLALLAALAARRAHRPRARAAARAAAAAAAAAAVSVAFFLQCGLDWLEEVPALLAPAVCLPFAVLRASRDCDGRPSALRAAPAAALAVIALVALTPVLSRRPPARARRRRARERPARGAGRLRPRRLCRPAVAHAAPAQRLRRHPARDEAVARRAFQEALDVQDNWVSHFELGLLDLQAGRFDAPRDRAHPRRAAQPQRPDGRRRADRRRASASGSTRPSSTAASSTDPVLAAP